jgi:hypothetical protein
MIVHMLKRLELSAALTGIAVSVGRRARHAVVITAGLCPVGEVIERLTMPRRMQLP